MSSLAVSFDQLAPPVIRLLDDHTVNQIAAGEVVERPAAALKELVENALDAGASTIEVEIEDAGRRLIKVSDNGCGMSLAGAQLALQRHATSKICSVEDLSRVATLGFRGEAIPSIASVSRMTLSTGDSDGVRHVLSGDSGRMSDARTEGGPRGTTISIEDLFLNTPARLKFLKSDTTEISACVDVINKYAVARPDVSFRLICGGNVMLQTGGNGDQVAALAEVWGRDVARALVAVDDYQGLARVHGWVSPPHFTKPTRAMQWLFVNGRPIRSRTLMAAIDQAYRALTPEKRYAMAFLMIEIDPAKVDVNVSPTKSEVKFHQEGAIFDVVRRGIKNALLAAGMVPSMEDVIQANEAVRAATPSSFGLPLGGYDPGRFAGSISSLEDRAGGHFGSPGNGGGSGSSLIEGAMRAMSPLGDLQMRPDPGARGDGGQDLGGGDTFGRPAGEDEHEIANPRAEEFLDGLKVHGQMDDTLIIAENRTHLLIIDQHVAHERILYELLRETRGKGAIEVQRLVIPETLHLDKRSAAVILEQMAEFTALGFELEPFGGDSFLIRAVPALWRGVPPLDVLRDIVDELLDGVKAGGWTPMRDDVLILASCKRAVKAGDRLGHAEMVKLIEDLARTENPYLCPHGRPITIVMPKRDLLKKFKR